MPHVPTGWQRESSAIQSYDWLHESLEHTQHNVCVSAVESQKEPMENEDSVYALCVSPESNIAVDQREYVFVDIIGGEQNAKKELTLFAQSVTRSIDSSFSVKSGLQGIINESSKDLVSIVDVDETNLSKTIEVDQHENCDECGTCIGVGEFFALVTDCGQEKLFCPDCAPNTMSDIEPACNCDTGYLVVGVNHGASTDISGVVDSTETVSSAPENT